MIEFEFDIKAVVSAPTRLKADTGKYALHSGWSAMTSGWVRCHLI